MNASEQPSATNDQAQREPIHLTLIADARRGLADVAAGRSVEADAALAAVQERRAGHHGSTARGSSTSPLASGA